MNIKIYFAIFLLAFFFLPNSFAFQSSTIKYPINEFSNPPIQPIISNYEIKQAQGWYDNALDELTKLAQNKYPKVSKNGTVNIGNLQEKFIEDGLHIISQAKKIDQLIEFQQRNIALLETMLQVNGIEYFDKLQNEQKNLADNMVLSWELKRQFDELVR